MNVAPRVLLGLYAVAAAVQLLYVPWAIASDGFRSEGSAWLWNPPHQDMPFGRLVRPDFDLILLHQAATLSIFVAIASLLSAGMCCLESVGKRDRRKMTLKRRAVLDTGRISLDVMQGRTRRYLGDTGRYGDSILIPAEALP